MTSLTLVTLVVIVYGVLNSGGYGRALALGGATAAGAAAVVGSVAVPTFYAVALGTVVALGLQLLGNGRSSSLPRRRLPPGASLLLLFLGWSALVTVLAPTLFDGTEVLTPGGARRLASGFLTASNIAQVIYLVLGVCVVVFLARSARAGPELIGLAAGATTLLSLWRYLNEGIGLPFPEGVFDNSPFLAYIETVPGGVERFRGILSEPAGLAASSLVTISYMLSRSLQVRGWRRAGALGVAGAAMFLGSNLNVRHVRRRGGGGRPHRGARHRARLPAAEDRGERAGEYRGVRPGHRGPLGVADRRRLRRGHGEREGELVIVR